LNKVRLGCFFLKEFYFAINFNHWNGHLQAFDNNGVKMALTLSWLNLNRALQDLWKLTGRAFYNTILAKVTKNFLQDKQNNSEK
jgi:hypothetical protein